MNLSFLSSANKNFSWLDDVDGWVPVRGRHCSSSGHFSGAIGPAKWLSFLTNRVLLVTTTECAP